MATATQRTDRIPCSVPFCRRTAPRAMYGQDSVIICGRCWGISSSKLRRRIRFVERYIRKLGADVDTVTRGEANANPKLLKAMFLHTKLFDKIVVSATEKRAGIAA